MKDLRDENLSPGIDSTCERVEDRIHELMDLRQSLLSDEIVRQHISECDQCAELVVDFGALNESLSQIPLETIYRLSELHATDVDDVSPRRLHPLTFVASIACLLLVMLTSGIWFSDKQPETAPGELATYETVDPSELEFDEIPQAGPEQLAFVPHKGSPSIGLMNAVSIERLSGEVEPYQDYLNMTADLPGIQPVRNSFNATLHLIRTISEKPSTPKSDDQPVNKPDVGLQSDVEWPVCYA